MKFRQPQLREDVTITVDNEGKAVLYSCLSPRQPRIRMHPTTAQIVISMNGVHTEQEIITCISDLTGSTEQASRQILVQIYNRYGGYIVEGEQRSPRYWADEAVQQIASSDPTPPDKPQLRMPAPLIVDWIVTKYCNRRCVYCYNDAEFAVDAGDDNRLSRDRMISLLDESYAIGVQQVKLLGGEPLMYAGAFDIVSEAVKRGFDVDIITKWSFDRETAHQLASTGLQRIGVSLDSVTPVVGDRLVGHSGFVHETLSSIANLIDEGISVMLDCVICKPNLEDLDDLAKRMRETGVARVNVSEYVSSLGRTSPKLDLSPADRDHMKDIIERHRDILVGVNDINETIERECSIAVSELAFLPDGRVPLCYQLPLAYNTELHYGDVSKQSILDVWNQWPSVWDREKFAGTLCYDCSYFDRCNSKGRCLSAVVMNCGQPFGPHPNCPAVQ